MAVKLDSHRHMQMTGSLVLWVWVWLVYKTKSSELESIISAYIHFRT